jgi:Protein of unknown function (DUF2914)
MKRLSSMMRVMTMGVMLASATVALADDAKPKAPGSQPSAPAAPTAPDTAKTKPAPPPAEAAPPAPSSGTAAAEVHVGTGYEKHAIVGEAATFAPGTKVFVVSLVTGANGTAVKHVWKKDGAELWTGTLNIGSNKWTTSTRRVLSKAGSYEVSVVGADGAELGKVEFTIQ